jgi:hypothetical protein
MATVERDRIGAGFRASEKKAVQQTFSADLQPVGNLRGAIGLIDWRQSRFSKAITADERICTRGDVVWQPATGNVSAGPACCPTG